MPSSRFTLYRATSNHTDVSLSNRVLRRGVLTASVLEKLVMREVGGRGREIFSKDKLNSSKPYYSYR